MKWIAVLFILFTVQSYGQCKTFVLTAKGDTLNCTDVNGKRQGKWVVKVPALRTEPEYEEEGEYVDGLKEGVWRQYSKMGDLKAVEGYRWGMKDGASQYFNLTAGLIREESWKAVNPADPYDTVDVEDVNNPGKFTKVRVKLDGKALKHGIWRFYDNYSGALVKSEKYYMGKLEDPNQKPNFGALTGETTASTNNNSTSDSTKPATKVKPKEVMEFEKKNAGKKKVKVRDGRTGG